MTQVQYWQSEKKVRDRADMALYNVKIHVAAAFSNRVHVAEYYHNSSWLEHGGAPDKAVRNASSTRSTPGSSRNNKYNKNESKITFQDVEDCLVIVISSFSTQTSYENQTKKAITNKGIQEAMVEMLRHNLEIYFIENPMDAERIAGAGAHQQAQPGGRGKDKAQHQDEAHREDGHHQPGGGAGGLPLQRREGAGACSSWRASPP